MSYKYIIDSSAWIEYFNGRINEIKEIIEKETIATSIIAIAELADKFEREDREFSKYLKFIQSRAAILPLTLDIVFKAAKIKKEFRGKNPKFGLADALHLSTTLKENSILLTTDKDFSGSDNVLII